jgi:hypothetical protein
MNFKGNKTATRFALLNDFFVHNGPLSTSYPQSTSLNYAILSIYKYLIGQKINITPKRVYPASGISFIHIHKLKKEKLFKIFSLFLFVVLCGYVDKSKFDL